MKKRSFLVFMLVFVLAMTTLIGCTPAEDNDEPDTGQVTDEDTKAPEDEDLNDDESKEEVELLVSAAASLTDVLEDIKVAYKEKAPQVTLTYTLGSSGALQAQIEEGAPVDIFMSAAEKQMDALEEGENLAEGTRKSLLINKVVLISPKDSDLDIKTLEDLANDDIKNIGVGDPGNVPVGQYTEEIFKNLDLTDKLADKLVLGNDVRTVLTWVETGEVDAGLVYKTDAMSTDDVDIVTEAPEDSHKLVSYPVAVIKDSNHQEEAKEFLDFLSTDEAGELFEKYGFTIK